MPSADGTRLGREGWRVTDRDEEIGILPCHRRRSIPSVDGADVNVDIILHLIDLAFEMEHPLAVAETRSRVRTVEAEA